MHRLGGAGMHSGMHSRKPSALTYADIPPPMGMNGGLRGGQSRMPRHRATDSQQVRDAEEFELEGLMSEDEAGGSGETGLTSPLSEDLQPKERSKIGSGV